MLGRRDLVSRVVSRAYASVPRMMITVASPRVRTGEIFSGVPKIPMTTPRDGRAVVTVKNAMRMASASSSASSSSMHATDSAMVDEATQRQQWRELARAGVDVNPCNSPKHPAAIAGIAPVDANKAKRSLQEAYDPYCIDFVCGHAHETNAGIGLCTYRCEEEENVLESHCSFPETYEEFPGIIGPAMYGVAASTHGNWAASIALMDRAILPRPPLVAVKSMSVRVRDLIGPGEPVVIRSKILSIRDEQEPFKVSVAVTIKSKDRGVVLANAECDYEKIGAVRSMR